MKQVRISLTGRQAVFGPGMGAGMGGRSAPSAPDTPDSPSRGRSSPRGVRGGVGGGRSAKGVSGASAAASRTGVTGEVGGAGIPEAVARGRVSAPGRMAQRQAQARAAMPKAAKKGRKGEEEQSLLDMVLNPMETARQALEAVLPEPVQQVAQALSQAASMASPAAVGKTIYSEFVEPGLEQDLAGASALRSEAGLVASADEIEGVRSRAAEHDVTAELSGMVEAPPSDAQTARGMLDRGEALAAQEAADRAAFGPDIPDPSPARPPATPEAAQAEPEKPGGVEFAPMTSPTKAPDAASPEPEWLAELKRQNDKNEQRLRNRRARQPMMPAFV